MPEKKIPLMTEERVNWYLRELDNPTFSVAIAQEGEGAWEAVKEKLILSLKFYKIPIPDSLK